MNKKTEFYTILEEELADMTNRSRIYKILKKHLSRMGYWKLLPRGNPIKAHRTMLQNKASYNH